MDVSVIIVNWNTKKLLQECLKSIYLYTTGVDFEVIVIDNGSDDESTQMVKREFPQVILIENLNNRGFASANNQGISVAKGLYILLLNSDTLLTDNSIGKVIKYAANNDKAAVIGCKILNPDKSLQPSCFMFPSVLNLFLSTFYLCHLFPQSKYFGRERLFWWNWRERREVDVVAGCFMLVRREAIEQVGWMDERYFMYFEETDWCFRFKKAGWKVMFFPDVEIIHYGGASSGMASNKMAIEYVKSMLYFFRRHKNSLSYRLACFLLVLNFSLRAPYWLGRALSSKNARSQHLQRAKNLTAGALQALLGVRT